MRLPLATCATVALLVSSAPSAPAAAATDLQTLRATVKFPVGGTAARGGAALALKGDLLVDDSLSGFEPLTDSLRVTFGPVVLYDAASPPLGSKVRRTASGAWSLVARTAGGRFALRMQRASGRFTLRASGLDTGALREAGPTGVVLTMVFAGDASETSVDFVEKGKRHWTHVFQAPPRPVPGGGNQGGGTPPPPAPATFTTVAQGYNSRIQTFRFEVIRDQASWQTLWTAHAGSGTAPAVNFSTETVIGIWIGSRNSGGYSVTIRAAVPATILGAPDTPQGVMLDVLELQPGPGCAVTDGFTSPFHVIRLPRVDGPAIFELTTQNVVCF